MQRLKFFSFLAISACVSGAESGAPVKPHDGNPKVSISKLTVTEEGFLFDLMLVGTSKEFCFDGSDMFPIGLNLRNAGTGATLQWINGPVIQDGKESIQTRYVLEPNASLTYRIVAERPLSGPYDIRNVSSFYSPGDQLVAVAMQRFYDCAYPSVYDALRKGDTITVESAQSRPISE